MGLLGAVASAHPLTDLVNRAYQTSPAIKIAEQNLLVAEKELSNRKANFLPTLDFTASHGLQKNKYSVPTDPWTSSLGLTLNQPLYDNHRTINQYQIASLRRESAAASLRQAKNTAAVEVASAFIAWSLAVRKGEVQKIGLGLYDKQYRFVESQYKQGLKPKKDFLKFKAQWERAVLGDTSASTGVAQAKYELLNRIGSPPETELALVPMPAELDLGSVPKELPQILKNWSFRVAELETRIRPIEVYIASRDLWPQLNLTAGATYENNSYVNSGRGFGANESYGVKAALVLNYNILDWGVRSRTVSIEEHRKTIEVERMRQTSLQLGQDAATLMANLVRLKQAYEVAASIYKNEEESYQATQRDFREGKVNSYDFINYVRDYLEGNNLYLTSRYDLWNAVLRHYYLSGELDEYVTKL